VDLDKYSKVDGKIVKNEEISVETLQAIKTDAENTISGLTATRDKMVADYAVKINEYQLQIDKINDLLK